jgi:Protein of unknown function (DUF3501)
MTKDGRMHPLTLDDLLPLDEYAGRRREFFESHHRYLDRYRRIRLGPRLTLLFENRQTLWYRVQELLRVARLSDPGLVQRELDLYNRLLPGRNELQASLLIEVTDEARLTEQLAAWRGLRDDELALHVGATRFPARLVTCRPEDRSIGAAHWVQFDLGEGGGELLANRRQAAYFAVEMATYRHRSPPLSEDVRQSLLEDLELSERG